MMSETSFNSTPIRLQPPTITSSSLTMDDQINQDTAVEQNILANMYYYSLQKDDSDDGDDDMIMEVPQHLDSEQIKYEFPLRSHLKALAYLDQLGEEYSFFDETSFTSLTNDSSTSSSSASILSGYFGHGEQDDISSTTTPLEHINDSTIFSSLNDEKENDLDLTRMHHHHMLSQQQQSYSISSSSSLYNYHHGIQQGERSAPSLLVVDDNRLSPLQLPAQAAHLLQREQSYESTSTITKNAMVAPQSFLAMPTYNNVDSSAFVQPPRFHAPSRRNSLESVDLPIIFSETSPIQGPDSDDGSSLTSDDLYPPQQVVIIRLSNMQQQKRCRTPLTYLATDEGYDDDDQDGGKLGDCEIESVSVFLPLDDDEQDSGDLATPSSTSVGGHGLWESFQQQQRQWEQRIQQLERQLVEERAMRQAFEKAMEDMTVLMDQQQKVLYDRLEQEINMRQAYEHKMQQTLSHVEPLECRLENETASRIQLEETMVHVLDQLELLHSQHQQHTKDNTIQHNRMQTKLDQALDDISDLSTKVSALETSTPSASTSASTLASSHKNHAVPANNSRYYASSTLTATTTTTTTTMSSKGNTNRMKHAARSNATSFNHAAVASGTTAITSPPRSKTIVTAAKSTTTNKSKPSIAPTSASVSRRSKVTNNSRSTKTTTTKNGNGNGSGNSDPDSHSSLRRVDIHR